MQDRWLNLKASNKYIERKKNNELTKKTST